MADTRSSTSEVRSGAPRNGFTPISRSRTSYLTGSDRDDWQFAVLTVAVAWGVALVTITEVMSLFTALTSVWVAATWLMVGLTTAAYAVVRVRRLTPPPRLCMPSGWSDRLLLGGITIIVGLTAVVAAAAPPNTWDSLTYHMSRVAHWQQQASVAYYPTHILRQLHQTPWAEFAILHLQILTGGDHLANFVQWTCMAGSLVGVSLIARQLGGAAPAQLLAAAFAASLPMGVLQASSTQTDYAVSFWLVCFVVFALRTLKAGGRWGSATLLVLGASLGLSWLAKTTAYLFAAPFIAWLIVAWIRARGIGALTPLIVIGSVAVALNVGYYARNLATYQSPLGPGHEDPPGAVYVNGLFTPAALASNLIRDASLEMITPSREFNAALDASIRRIHRVLGMDVSDPRTTWQQIPGEPFYVPPTLDFDEDNTSNPLHFGLVIVSAALLLWRRRLGGQALLPYAAAVAGGFVLFALVLRWQPWHSRLLLPLLVLSAPLVGTLLASRLPRGWLHALGLGLLVAALPWLLWSYSRPLVGDQSVLRASRTQQYFRDAPELYSSYLSAAGAIAAHNCRAVGVLADWNDWEYPLWVVLHEHGLTDAQIEHVDVHNVSAGIGGDSFEPCAIVALADVEEEPWPAWTATKYTPINIEGPLRVLVRTA